MNPEFPGEDTLYDTARRLEDPAARQAFLDEACAGNPALRCRLDALLQAAPDAEDFFSRHAVDLQRLPPFSPDDPTRMSLPGERPGDGIGRYKLLQEIGEGGFGTVWMAEQTEPVVRCVALKIIKPGMDTNEVIARFEAERQALAMMDHPNIARVLDAGATGQGRPFFVMELVKGMPITQYCDEAGLGTYGRLDLFCGVCAAISHAHQKGIIHRDIKPSNVMVTLHGDQPVVKVIDFGIAKATQGKLTDKTLFTRYGQFIGTPAYMSPEQAATSGLDIDTRSDIYALGILLYELLTGKPPFDGKSLASAGYEEMRRIIREVDPPKPSSQVGTARSTGPPQPAKTGPAREGAASRLVEPDLDWIVMKAIEKDRTRRYATANAFAQDIAHFLAHEPVSAREPGAFYLLSRFVRRHRTACGAAVAVLMALILGLVGTGYGYVRAEQARGRAEKSSEDARSAALAERQARAQTQAMLSDTQAAQGVEWLMAHNPKGLLHLVEARRTAGDLPALWSSRTLLWQGWMESLPVSVVQTLPYPWDVVAMDFSPEGHQLGVRASPTAPGEGAITVFDLTGRKPPEVLPEVEGGMFRFKAQEARLSADGPPPQVQVSPDGVAVAAYATTPETRGPPRVYKLASGSVTAAYALQANGSLLALGGRDGTVEIWNWQTGKREGSTLHEPSAISVLAFSADGKALAAATGAGLVSVHHLPAEPAPGIPVPEVPDALVLAAAPDGRVLLSSGEEGKLTWFNPGTGENLPLETDSEPEGKITAALLDPQGRLLATRSGDTRSMLQWWHHGKPGAALDAGTADVLALSPDGRTAAMLSSMDGSILLWEVGAERPQAHLKLHRPVETTWVAVRFSPDGQWLVSQSGMLACQIWKTAEGKPVDQPEQDPLLAVSRDWKHAVTLKGIADFADPSHPGLLHSCPTGAAVFSHDGRLVAISQEDGQILLYDPVTGKSNARPFKQNRMSLSMVFTPDDSLLLIAGDAAGGETGGTAGALILLDPVSGLPCGFPRPGGGPLADYLVTADGAFAVSRGGPAVHCWKLPSAKSPLEVMELMTWRMVRSRLTTAGGAWPLTAAEIMALEEKSGHHPK